jgi:hypothetical protein
MQLLRSRSEATTTTAESCWRRTLHKWLRAAIFLLAAVLMYLRSAAALMRAHASNHLASTAASE